MDWNLGEVFLTMLAFFFWFTFIWMFVGVFADIFRRTDLTGWGKAGWVFLVCVMPFLGVLIYMIARPVPEAEVQAMYAAAAGAGAPQGAAFSSADEIAKLTQLH